MITTMTPALSLDTFDGQNGPEPVEIDKERALALRAEGKTWTQVAEAMGQAMHRVYHACHLLEVPRPKEPSKWESLFTQLAALEIGESATVELPENSTRSQMNSALAMNNRTAKWHWSLHGLGEGKITVVKGELWTTPVSVPTKRPKVVKEVADKQVEVGRKVVILLPDAKPISQLVLNPAMAQAIWDTLTLEQKATLIDVDDLWNTWDDWCRMSILSKIMLVSEESINAK